MHLGRRITTGRVAFLFLGMALFAQAVAQQVGGELHVAYREEIRSLDTIINMGVEGFYIHRQITEGMVTFDVDGNIVPALAESWEQLDATTFLFHLRSGVQFHNGDEVTAEDVKYSWDRLADPEAGGHYWQWAQSIVESVEEVDRYTVRLNLHRPWPELFEGMAHISHFNVHSKRAIEEAGEDYGSSVVIGTGPFRLAEWVRNSHVRVERFDGYRIPENVPYLDAVIFYPIPEDSTRIAQYLSGDLDVLYVVPYDMLAGLQADPNTVVMTRAGSTFNWIMLNSTRAPFNDRRVRQAFYYAIDRNLLVDAMFLGLGDPASGPIPPWHWGYDESYADTVYPYDPETAQRLLEEAGYGPGNRLEVDLLVANTPHYVDIATFVQSQLAQVGVTLHLTVVERTTQFEAQRAFDYDSLLFRYVSSPQTSELTWRRYHSSSDVMNTINQPNGAQRPELDTLLDEFVSVEDPVREQELLELIVDIVNEEATLLVLNWEPNVVVAGSHVHDLPLFIRNDMPLRGVWLDGSR